jgi:hypothetical protein
VEDLLREGEKIQITKCKRVGVPLAREKPATPARRPDFLARLNALYGGRRMKVSGAELLTQERGRR